jgi:hypothetical protein
MPRRARVDWDAVHAAAPDRLILVRTLLELGVPSSTIAFRCRKVGGLWWRPLLGLVALTRGTLTVRQRLVAALLAAGDDAVVTGLAACRLYGLQRVPAHDQVHVLVPHERRRRSEGFLLVERTGRMLPAVSRDGIRCAPLARALVDGARRLDRIDEVRPGGCEAQAVGRARAGASPSAAGRCDEAVPVTSEGPLRSSRSTDGALRSERRPRAPCRRGAPSPL